MKKNKIRVVAILLILFSSILISFAIKNASNFRNTSGARTNYENKEDLLGNMNVTDWSPDGTTLVGHKKDKNGVFQVYTWDSEGLNEKKIPVPDNVSGLSAKCHMGFPHYGPTGRYIVLAVEMDFYCPKKFSEPGLASSTNLWIIDTQTNTWTNLTNYPFPKNETDLNGALSPYISPDGKKVMWAKILEKADYTDHHKIFGKWEIHIADLYTDGTPRIANDTVYNFEGGNLYEPHGFSPDGNRIMFSSDIGLEYSGALDIFEYDLQTRQLTNLTNTDRIYEEHSRYLPDGQSIVYGSTRCCKSYNPKWFLATLKSEGYLVKLNDLDNPIQLTKHNVTGGIFSRQSRTGNWTTAVSPAGDEVIVWQQFYDDRPGRVWKVSIGDK